MLDTRMKPETARPQQDDLRLSGPPTGQGAGDGARTSNKKLRGFVPQLRCQIIDTVLAKAMDADSAWLRGFGV
ncbi:hypothetical protein PoB_005601400 [Plakobranchus ocellatus]|uniref:Uncharacterized protein n=1 Tax=Plakobranchus ocellatus TaxID=259542 RepID=A0AAV4CAC7_9GAST|nr:hypothetical protein PoB_005601400 [Plakobranchus ocellatus]